MKLPLHEFSFVKATAPIVIFRYIIINSLSPTFYQTHMIVHPQISKLHLHISKSPPLVTFNPFNIFYGCIQHFSSLSKKRISTSSVKMRSIFILLPTYQPTFNLNFCISFSDVTFSIQAPRLVSFPSKFSYPR